MSATAIAALGFIAAGLFLLGLAHIVRGYVIFSDKDPEG
jgi:hypothetical protein